MKKLILTALAIASTTVFAAQEDVCLTFSTKGPDRYANGDVVADGECYCVIWTKTGCDFKGFEADGTAKGDCSKVLLTAPIAFGGRCPKANFQISAKLVNALGSGKYSVCLLDTRNVSGVPQGTVLKDDVWYAKAINSWGLIQDATTKLASVTTLGSRMLESKQSSQTTYVSSAEGAPQPTITGVKIEDNLVKITVADTAEYLQYTVKAGETPDEDALKKDGSVAAQGNGKEITISYPVEKGGKFFRVIRN